jgi:hypothetical protein
VLKLVTFLYQTPAFEWYVVRFDYKNGYRIDICLKEIGVRAENMITTLGSIVSIIGEHLYGHLMSTRIFNLILSKTFILALNVIRKPATALI